jgi:hypothetical protein
MTPFVGGFPLGHDREKGAYRRSERTGTRLKRVLRSLGYLDQGSNVARRRVTIF